MLRRGKCRGGAENTLEYASDCCGDGRSIRNADTADLRADRGELADEVFVAALNVFNVLDRCLLYTSDAADD